MVMLPAEGGGKGLARVAVVKRPKAKRAKQVRRREVALMFIEVAMFKTSINSHQTKESH